MANRAEKRFGLTNQHIIVLGIEFRYVVTGIYHDLSSAATHRPGLQSVENTTPVAATTRILVNRPKSYLGLVRGVEMQTSAGQRLPRRIKKEGIALTPAWLTPRLAENSPPKIKVGIPFVRGHGTWQN